MARHFKHDRDRREEIPVNRTTLRNKDWSEGDLEVPLEGAAKDARMTIDNWEDRFQEVINPYFTEALEGAETPPPEVQVRFEEVFGEEAKAGLVRFVFDNWFHRWVVIQKCDNGLWKRALVFSDSDYCTGHGDEKLPADLEALNEDGRYDALRGQIGSYRMPTVEDIATLKAAADRFQQQDQWSKVQVDRKAKEMAELNAKVSDWEHDWWGHRFELWRRDYHQAVGGMQGLAFVPGTSLEQLSKELEPILYDIEQRNGYKVKRRKRDPETAKALAREAFERAIVRKIANSEEYANLSDLDKDLLDRRFEELKDRLDHILDAQAKDAAREAHRAVSGNSQRDRQLDPIPAPVDSESFRHRLPQGITQ